jgi:hypothetical protein
MFVSAHALLRYAATLISGSALVAVRIDAAFGEVVGSTAGKNENAPAVGY